VVGQASSRSGPHLPVLLPSSQHGGAGPIELQTSGWGGGCHLRRLLEPRWPPLNPLLGAPDLQPRSQGLNRAAGRAGPAASREPADLGCRESARHGAKRAHPRPGRAHQGCRGCRDLCRWKSSAQHEADWPSSGRIGPGRLSTTPSGMGRGGDGGQHPTQHGAKGRHRAQAGCRCAGRGGPATLGARPRADASFRGRWVPSSSQAGPARLPLRFVAGPGIGPPADAQAVSSGLRSADGDAPWWTLQDPVRLPGQMPGIEATSSFPGLPC